MDLGTGVGLLARLQAASLQSKNDDCAGFFDPLASLGAAPSIPSLRNERPILSILKEIFIEETNLDEKRSGSRPNKSLLEEVFLGSGSGLKSFEGGTGFIASVRSIFDDFSPSKVSMKYHPSSLLEDVNRTRVEFVEQVGLGATSTFGYLSSSLEM